MPEPLFAIVIPSGSPSNLYACIEALIAHNEHSVRVAVWDGEEPATSSNYLRLRGGRPFNFARNVNEGLRALGGRGGAVVMGDDCLLLTPEGFSIMARCAADHPEIGLWSPQIKGHVANPEQRYAPGRSGHREASQALMAVCWYLPATTIEKVGYLDESFEGYGYDDVDYSLRVQQAGLGLGICDGCVVEHGSLPSVYLARSDFGRIYAESRRRFEEKWGKSGLILPPHPTEPPA